MAPFRPHPFEDPPGHRLSMQLPGNGGMKQDGPKMVGPHPSHYSDCYQSSLQSPEIRKYKRKFNGEILCGALWGVNLLVGTDNGLLLLDRSGHGKGVSLSLVGCMAPSPPPPSLSLCAVFPLISRRRFAQMEVLEGLNVLVCINGRKNKLRVYYLSWLRNKIVKGDDVS